MYIYFNAFWGDNFFNGTDGVNVKFFIALFEKVYNEKCEIGTYENSDILCESLFGESQLLTKEWKHTILYSGESRLRENSDLYTVILYGQKTHKNIINVPFFIPYMYCNNLLTTFESSHLIPRLDIPKQDIIVIISNTLEGYTKRLEFIEILDKEFNITYAGKYKNNIGYYLPYNYYSLEFKKVINNYKFVVSMENSIEETYITEKICHGMNSKIIPIYWGTKNVNDYFNEKRFVFVDDTDYNKSLVEIKELYKDNEKWLKMVNEPVFKNNKLTITLDSIAKEIQELLKIK